MAVDFTYLIDKRLSLYNKLWREDRMYMLFPFSIYPPTIVPPPPSFFLLAVFLEISNFESDKARMKELGGRLSSSVVSGLSLLLLLFVGLCSCDKGTVYYDSVKESYSFTRGVIDKNGVAYGSYDDNIMQDGN